MLEFPGIDLIETFEGAIELGPELDTIPSREHELIEIQEIANLRLEPYFPNILWNQIHRQVLDQELRVSMRVERLVDELDLYNVVVILLAIEGLANIDDAANGTGKELGVGVFLATGALHDWEDWTEGVVHG